MNIFNIKLTIIALIVMLVSCANKNINNSSKSNNINEVSSDFEEYIDKDGRYNELYKLLDISKNVENMSQESFEKFLGDTWMYGYNLNTEENVYYIKYEDIINIDNLYKIIWKKLMKNESKNNKKLSYFEDNILQFSGEMFRGMYIDIGPNILADSYENSSTENDEDDVIRCKINVTIGTRDEIPIIVIPCADYTMYYQLANDEYIENENNTKYPLLDIETEKIIAVNMKGTGLPDYDTNYGHVWRNEWLVLPHKLSGDTLVMSFNSGVGELKLRLESKIPNLELLKVLSNGMSNYEESYFQDHFMTERTYGKD